MDISCSQEGIPSFPNSTNPDEHPSGGRDEREDRLPDRLLIKGVLLQEREIIICSFELPIGWRQNDIEFLEE